jgi:hypothetical protein
MVDCRFHSTFSLRILKVDIIDFLCNVWLFILFKILILIYKIISYILNFFIFSDKSNRNKIYGNYLKI